MARIFMLGHNDLEQSYWFAKEPQPQARPHSWAEPFNWFLRQQPSTAL